MTEGHAVPGLLLRIVSALLALAVIPVPAAAEDTINVGRDVRGRIAVTITGDSAPPPAQPDVTEVKGRIELKRHEFE
jgi:hypothetical protein